MSRPLFIYVNTDEADSRPELAAFVDYYLSDEGIAAVTEADYVALDERRSRRRARPGKAADRARLHSHRAGRAPLARPGAPHLSAK